MKQGVIRGRTVKSGLYGRQGKDTRVRENVTGPPHFLPAVTKCAADVSSGLKGTIPGGYMHGLRLIVISAFCALVTAGAPLAAQGNIDWAEQWRHTPPAGQPAHPFAWMNDSLSYTGLAYDQTRNLVYVVSPQFTRSGGWLLNEPRIYVLDPDSGGVRRDVGRSAFPGSRGAGGELPVPLDTFITASVTSLGFAQNRFAVFKIDVDDEGRIYVCNLVNPLWGYCRQVSPTVIGCDSDYLDQGPLRIWRWDTPTSTPELIYATLNTAATAIGSAQDSELPATRWGDAFAVTGKRAWHDPPGPDPPVLHDSVRIYVGGGNWPGQLTPNGEIAVLVEDRRPAAQRPDRDTFGGGKLSFRLGLLLQTQRGIASHGVAPEPVTEFHGHITGHIWTDNNTNPAVYVPELQSGIIPLPQTYMPLVSQMYTLPTSLTGPGGALAWHSLPSFGRKFLVVADGMPTAPTNPSVPNDNTTARMIDVSTQGQEFAVYSPTPRLGSRILESIDQNNFVADVDISSSVWETPVGTWDSDVRLYVLMSNNGIACYRARPTAVQLSTFDAVHEDGRVQLRWCVESEQSSLRFIVQRAPEEDGPWTEIGSVPARGTTHEAATYSFADPLGGNAGTSDALWYRLVEEDTHGTRTVYPALRVLMPATAISPRLDILPHPLPAGSDAVTVQVRSAREGQARLGLYDVLGRKVAGAEGLSLFRGSNLHTLRVPALRAGMYVLVLRATDGTHRQTRLLVR